MLGAAAKALESASKRTGKIAEIQRLFEPFSSQLNGPFDCSNTRRARSPASATKAISESYRGAPESLEWMDWMMNVHMPAIEKRVIPEMDRRVYKEPKPLTPHATIVSMLDEMAERHDLALALQQVTDDGLTRTTFRDLKQRADATASRLAALGVGPGDRVVLSARSHPDWAIAYFGIVRAGATAVPVDPALDAIGWRTILDESGARAVVWDETARARKEGAAFGPAPAALDLHASTQPDKNLVPPQVTVEPDDIASLIYTSGTTASAPRA